MAADKQQRLSAWMDGEADEIVSDEMIDELLNDPELQSAYSRYQLIGDGMRGELPPVIDVDLCSRVAAAIEQEPTVLAPKRSAGSVKPGKVATMFRQIGQYAIAATVAAVTVLGVQHYNQSSPHEIPSPVLNTTPLVGLAAPVSLSAPAPQRVVSEQEHVQQRLLEQRRRINAYLQDHEQQRRLQPATVVEQADVESNKVANGAEQQ